MPSWATSTPGLKPSNTASQLFNPGGSAVANVKKGGAITPHDILDPGGFITPTTAQQKATKAAIAAPQLAADQSLIYKRQRQRASALSTGAGPSGTAATTSAMAYGLPTLGG